MPRRRSKGKGSVYPIKNGDRWIAALTVRGKRRTRTAMTEQLAYAALERMRIQYGVRYAEDGTEIIQTVSDIAERYFRWASRHRRGCTFDSYRSAWNAHLKPAFGGVLIDDLMPADIDNFVFDQLDKGLAASTVAVHLAPLRNMFALAVRDGIAWRNPAALVSVPRTDREIHRTILLPNEIPKLIEACGTSFHGTAVLTLITTGLRIGELCALQWRDFDEAKSRLSINRKVVYRKKTFEIETTKTSSSRRNITIPRVTRDSLVSHKNRCKTSLNDHISDVGPDDFIFRSARNGQLLSPWTVRNRVLPKITSRAGLPRVRPHELRHAAATFLLHQGETPHVVSAILGHANVGTTLTLYAHVLPGQNDRAAARFDEFLEKSAIDSPDPDK